MKKIPVSEQMIPQLLSEVPFDHKTYQRIMKYLNGQNRLDLETKSLILSKDKGADGDLALEEKNELQDNFICKETKDEIQLLAIREGADIESLPEQSETGKKIDASQLKFIEDFEIERLGCRPDQLSELLSAMNKNKQISIKVRHLILNDQVKEVDPVNSRFIPFEMKSIIKNIVDKVYVSEELIPILKYEDIRIAMERIWQQSHHMPLARTYGPKARCIGEEKTINLTGETVNLRRYGADIGQRQRLFGLYQYKQKNDLYIGKGIIALLSKDTSGNLECLITFPTKEKEIEEERKLCIKIEKI